MNEHNGERSVAQDGFLFTAGLGFLILAKAKNLLQGYTSPKPFALGEIERCVRYDLKVVDEWLAQLQKYAGASGTVAGKDILELGPGSDLGVGLYLLARGAATYSACDVNDLTKSASAEFYTALLQRIADVRGAASVDGLAQVLALARSASPSRLRVAVRNDFDLVAAFGRECIDLAFSQAAFEHFDDIDRTVRQLTAVCRPGAILVAEIDLKTHSRWIRDQDPNNIYRYPDWLYRRFWFRGIPNRVRPFEYRAALERHGWRDIDITPIEVISSHHPSPRSVHPRFRDTKNDMAYLSIMLCARKPAI